MRHIKTILILVLLLSCENNQIQESIWITNNDISCPYVIKFTEDLMWSNLTSSVFFEAYQYKIVDDKIIINLISDNIFGVTMPDTLNLSMHNNKLMIDSITYVRSEQDGNYYQSLLTTIHPGFQLPDLNYDKKIDHCAANDIVITKQKNEDSLVFYFNGKKLNESNLNNLYRHIQSNDPIFNSVRFFIDDAITYDLFNTVRSALRRINLHNYEYIYNKETNDLFNVYNTYGLASRGMRMTESEYKDYEMLNHSDSLLIRQLPPPNPLHYEQVFSNENCLLMNVSKDQIITYSNDSIHINDLGLDQLRKFINEKKILITLIDDKISYGEYLNFRLKINSSIDQLRDSIAISWYNEEYDNLAYDRVDSIDRITHVPILEMSQYPDEEINEIRNKYGL